MSNQPSPKTVCGFFNRMGATSFPAVLITVVESDGDYYGVYPSGDPVKLIDGATGLAASLEELSMRPNFIKAVGTHQADDFSTLTSFGIAANDIVIGTAQQVYDRIDVEIDRDQHTGDALQRLMDAHKSWEECLNAPKAP